MPYYFTSLILLLCGIAHAQCDIPAVVKSAQTIEAFVPANFEIHDRINGDFNADGLDDVILVLISKKEKDDAHHLDDCNRPLLILQKTKAGYILSAKCNEAVLCKLCGGAFGDPYESISLKKNILDISHYGGSAHRWSRNFTFRFQQHQWVLIGASESSYWSLGECDGSIGEAEYNLDDVNFLTGVVHCVRTKGNACTPYKDVWLRTPKKPLITLRSFNVGNNYIPKMLR